MKAFSSSTDSKLVALSVLHVNLIRSISKLKRENNEELYDKTQAVLKDLENTSKRIHGTKARRVSVSIPMRPFDPSPSEAQPSKSVSLTSIEFADDTAPAPLASTSVAPLPPLSAPDPVASDFDHHEDEPLDADPGPLRPYDPESEDSDLEEDPRSQDDNGGDHEEDGPLVADPGLSSAVVGPDRASSGGAITSPTALLPKAGLPKSKSGPNLASSEPPKRKKNKNIPNERLYRNQPKPTSATKVAQSPSLARSTSPTKRGSVTARATTSSPSPSTPSKHRRSLSHSSPSRSSGMQSPPTTTKVAAAPSRTPSQRPTPPPLRLPSSSRLDNTASSTSPTSSDPTNNSDFGAWS